MSASQFFQFAFWMPKLRKNGRPFTHKKTHTTVSAMPIGRPRTKPEVQPATPMSTMVQRLWGDAYWPLIQQLLDDHPELEESLSAHISQHRSKYRHSLDNEGLAVYEQRQQFKLATALQQVLFSPLPYSKAKLYKKSVKQRSQCAMHGVNELLKLRIFHLAIMLDESPEFEQLNIITSRY